jgi:hypothetical protein
MILEKCVVTLSIKEIWDISVALRVLGFEESVG